MTDALTVEAAIAGVSAPGQLLGARREEFGWSSKDVARALRLSERQILAIEQDDYTQLPGKTYVMGYWRSYAQLLQFNIEDSIQIHRANLSPGQKVLSIEPKQDKTRGVEERSRKRIAFMFAGLLSVFLAAVWYRQDPNVSMSHWINAGMDRLSGNSPQSVLDNEPTIESQITAIESEANQQSALVDSSVLALPVPNFSEDQQAVEINTSGYEVLVEEFPLSNPKLVFQVEQEVAEESTEGFASANVNASTQAQNATKVDAATAKAEIKTPVTNVSQQSTASTNIEIAFSVVKESWIDVRDSTGERLIYRTVNRGEDIRLLGKPPYSVFIGSAEGVTVQYGGKAVAFKPHESGLFARFEVGG